MVKTIEKHIDEIFNLLYGSKKNNKGEYWADVYKDALGSKDNGFYELFAQTIGKVGGVETEDFHDFTKYMCF